MEADRGARCGCVTAATPMESSLMSSAESPPRLAWRFALQIKPDNCLSSGFWRFNDSAGKAGIAGGPSGSMKSPKLLPRFRPVLGEHPFVCMTGVLPREGFGVEDMAERPSST